MQSLSDKWKAASQSVKKSLSGGAKGDAGNTYDIGDKSESP